VSQQRVSIGDAHDTIYSLEPSTGQLPASLNLLQPLFSSKRIVGLGEATHGTREFNQLKTQLVQFLITKCQYRALIMEGPFASFLFINDYVNNDEGNINMHLQHTGYWMYYTSEMRSLLEWIKKYNTEKSPEDKVSVFGMDMQDIEGPIQYVNSKMAALPARDRKSFDELMQPLLELLKSGDKHKAGHLSNSTHDIAAGIERLKTWVRTNTPVMHRYFTQENISLVELSLQNSLYTTQMAKLDVYFRDSCMAANVEALTTLTQGKTVLWAHNFHLGMHDSIAGYTALRKPMGELLQQTFKEQYYPIGFFFQEGGFIALEKKKRGKSFYYPHLKRFTLPAPANDYLSHQLSSSTSSPFFLDISSSENQFWKRYHKVYTIGATYNAKSNNTYYITPALAFKGIVFLPHTTPIVQLDDHFHPTK
jgi:erythromycin esterase